MMPEKEQQSQTLPAQTQESEKKTSNTYLRFLYLRARAKVRSVTGPFLKKMRRASLLRRERYIFTDKKHPEKGIFSSAMGLIALSGIALAVKFSFDRGGEAIANYAVAVLLSFVIALCGLVFGVIAHRQKDVFYLFPNFGIFFNVTALIACCVIAGLGLVS